MMKKNHFRLLAVLAAFSFSAGIAFSAELVDDIWELGGGAKSLAMGNTYASIGLDSADAGLNPAGIAMLKKREIGMLYSGIYDGLGTYTDLYLSAFVGLGTLAVNYSSIDIANGYSYPEGEGVDAYGLVEYNHDAKKITDNKTFINMSYAMKMGSLLLGVNVKTIQYKLLENTADGFGADLGIMYCTIAKDAGVTAGIMLRDVTGTKVTWNTGTSDESAMSMRAGVGFAMKVAKIGVDVDMKYGSDLNFGLELTPVETVALRAGMKSMAGSQDITAGIGLNLKAAVLDMAYTTSADMGSMIKTGIKVVF